MQRSSSSTRVSEECPKNNTATSTKEQELPTYDPLSHVARKERSRLRSAENAVHLIPLVLVIAVIILWFFSNRTPDQITLAEWRVRDVVA